MADDTPAGVAAAVAASATGAATERIIGAMLQRLDDGAAVMGGINAKLDRLDARLERIYERQDEIGRGLAAQEVRIATVEQALRDRRMDWRSAWAPIVAALAWVGSTIYLVAGGHH